MDLGEPVVDNTLICPPFHSCTQELLAETTAIFCVDGRYQEDWAGKVINGPKFVASHSGSTLVFDEEWRFRYLYPTTFTSQDDPQSRVTRYTAPTGIPHNAAEYLDSYMLKDDRTITAPECVNAMSTLCPGLYSFSLGCRENDDWRQVSCFCGALMETSCPGLCASKQEAKEYIKWITGFCGEGTVWRHITNGSGLGLPWPDRDTVYQNAKGKIPREKKPYDGTLFPWNWRVGPKQGSPETKCPSTSLKLGSFATINIIIGLLSIILGRRSLVQKITFGYLGRAGSPLWPLMGVISVALNLIANYINALLLRRIPAFSDVPVGSLVLFWCTRPRMAWMATALVWVQYKESM
jgi:hypothetical protein